MKMSSKPKQNNTQSLQPARSYNVPGGPTAKNLADVDVYKLAEVERGGENDSAR